MLAMHEIASVTVSIVFAQSDRQSSAGMICPNVAFSFWTNLTP
jgi:hypothetical protein